MSQPTPNPLSVPILTPTSGEMGMPPPSLVCIPPPLANLPTYTVKQLLSHQPQMPSPASGISASILASRANRPTHKSSAASDKYDPIHASRLRLIPSLPINEFREVIDSMDYIQFSQPMALPWEASPMLSEGCVTSYLDAQILGASWQAVLQMLPDERDYDLQMVKQVPLMEGTPDQTYSRLKAGTCEPLVVVEFKPAGVVKGLLSVLENAARGVKMDPTDDWKAVTRQLRMYASSSNVHDVLVMDESVCIYFCFPPDPSHANEVHEYLCASTEQGQSFGATPRLSIRELVVFALLSAFEKKNIELRDVSHRETSAVSVGPTTRPYRNVLSTPETPANSKRQIGYSTRKQDQKRGRRNDSVHDSFDHCFLGATLTFEILPDKQPVQPSTDRVRRVSLDSGFHETSTSTPHTSPSQPISTPASITASATIVRILKRGVAVVTDGRTQFVAKLFPPRPGTAPDKSLAQELAVYDVCATLQGSYIPYLYSVGRVVASDTMVLITEFVGCGTTVEDIISELVDEADISELVGLQTSATAALDAMHRLKVVHRDVAGRNMLLDGQGGIVLVDFGCARVLSEDLAGFRRGREEDAAGLREAFDVVW